MAKDTFGREELIAGDFKTRTYVDGTDLYICRARFGTALDTAAWQIKKSSVPAAGETLIEAAGGSLDFKWAATDLATVKDYSYS